VAALLLAVGRSADGQDVRRREKKLIATGWDKADPERLRQNLAEMEKRPFDGVVIEVEGKVDGKRRVAMRQTFSAEPWQREWFESEVNTIRQCRFKRFTDNFVTVGANPGNVDWFDDAGWRVIVEHWRIAAWLARASGFRGLLFDPEPYTKPWSQFRYGAQPERDRHSFDDYCAKARQRGREVMRAVADEFPDMVLFCYFMNSVCAAATRQDDPRPVLARHGYGLLPAFVDGWLDAVPPGVTMVDGCESAYRYNSVEQYLEAALLIKGACQRLVSAENRARYRAQVQVSFGIYLDAYSNPKSSSWYVDGLGGSRVERLGANVRTALRAADEFVWVYGEKNRWWPTPNTGVRAETWEEALPGCEAELGFARDPAGWARERVAALRAAGKLVNLARNGGFAADEATGGDGRAAEVWKEGRPPAGWTSWQEEALKGTFTWDRETGATGKGSARAAGVSNGCFMQRYDARPGERYAVRAMRRLRGKGEASIRVRWQTAEEKWIAEARDVSIFCAGPREEWSEMFGVVEVPEGADKLVILLGVAGQTSPDDVAWFDDVELYKLK
jgi:hypothetical protein